VTDIHRDWNQRYVVARFTTAVPRDFFDAVRPKPPVGRVRRRLGSRGRLGPGRVRRLITRRPGD